MPAISPALLRDGYKLTAEFYAAGIDCAPLVELNRWLLSQQIATGAAETPIGAASFDDALLSALKSSPRGIEIGDLRAILKDYDRTGAQIGAALGRMAKAGTALKRGALWFWQQPSKGNVDRSLTNRRPRAAKATPPAMPDSSISDQHQAATG